jgi:L-alanine-DL-glutamate epimerase-like enolase superfamily enzyme
MASRRLPSRAGQYRDRIRMYRDTPNEPDGVTMGERLKERISWGYTMLKMDVGIQPLIGVPGALTYPDGMLPGGSDKHFDKMLQLARLATPLHACTYHPQRVGHDRGVCGSST